MNYARSLSGVVAVEMSWGTGEFYGQNHYDNLFTTPAGHIGGSGTGGRGDVRRGLGRQRRLVRDLVSRDLPECPVGRRHDPQAGGEFGLRYRARVVRQHGRLQAEPAPSYQLGAQAPTRLSYGLRTTPDVSMVGDPSTGLSVYSTVPSAASPVGSRSAAPAPSAPLWAGLVAVADQGLALAGKGSLGAAQAALLLDPLVGVPPGDLGVQWLFRGERL